jgi:hypothetical protein
MPYGAAVARLRKLLAGTAAGTPIANVLQRVFQGRRGLIPFPERQPSTRPLRVRECAAAAADASVPVPALIQEVFEG